MIFLLDVKKFLVVDGLVVVVVVLFGMEVMIFVEMVCLGVVIVYFVFDG